MSSISSNISQSSEFSSNMSKSFQEAAKLVTGALISTSSLSPGTMKSENEVKVQLPEDTDPDSFATSSPPKKSRVLTREPCLICSKNENYQDSSSEDDPLCHEFELFQFPGASGSDLLNQQMWATFVLRKLLKLPLSKFTDILRTAGSSIHPHQWFSLCRGCSEMVNSIAESEVTIKLLQQKIKTITGTIKRNLEESLETEARKSRRKDKDNFFVIRSEIRKSLNIKASKKTTTATTTPHTAISTSSKPLMSCTSSTQAPMTMLELEPLVEQKPETDLINLGYSEVENFQETASSLLELEDTQRSDSDEEWIPNPTTPKSKSASRSRSNRKNSRVSRDPLEDHDDDGDDDDDQNEEEDQEESEFEDQNENDSDLEADSSRNRKRKNKIVKKKISRSNATEKGEHRCHICPRSFVLEAYLQNHLKYHRKTQKLFGGKRDCVLCKVPYDKFQPLKRHYRYDHHTSFHTSWDGEAPHQDYLYTDESKKVMLENLKSKGVDINARPALKLDENNDLEHKCHLCPKQFSGLNYFNKHLTYHKHCETVYGGRFDCFKCKVPHVSAKSLRQHFSFDHRLILDKDWDPNTPQMDHVKQGRLESDKLESAGSVAGGQNQDRNFKCEICGFLCKRSAGLKIHMNKKHEDSQQSVDVGSDDDADPGDDDHDQDYDPSADDSAPVMKKSKVNLKRASGSKSKIGRKKKENEDVSVTVDNPETEEKKIKCTFCNISCKTPGALRNHIFYKHKGKKRGDKMETTEEIGKFVCEKCGLDCGREWKLEKHIFSHKIYDNSVDPSISGTDFVCNLCQKTVPTRLLLYRHKMQQHHEELDLAVEKCEECPKVFRTKLQLNAHVQIIHRRLGKFNCDQCTYASMSKDAIERHMQKHEETREKKYVCEFCSASYCYLSAFRDHLQRYHLEQYEPTRNQGVFGGVAVDKLQSEEKVGLLKKVRRQGQKMNPVNCKYCEEVLPHALAFKMHLKSVHQDLYVHKCDAEDCGRTYMSLQSLQLHKKINHVNKQEVRCGWCFKKVLSKVYLYSHNKCCPKRPKTAENVPKIFVAGDESKDEPQAE